MNKKKGNLARIIIFVLWIISLFMVGRGKYGLGIIDWWWHTELFIPTFLCVLLLFFIFHKLNKEAIIESR